MRGNVERAAGRVDIGTKLRCYGLHMTKLEPYKHFGLCFEILKCRHELCFSK